MKLKNEMNPEPEVFRKSNPNLNLKSHSIMSGVFYLP
jgi:hypothetical protein